MSDLRVETGAAGLVLPGEAESGDLHLVAPFAGGALVAVVDGLGHGVDAAVAARLASETLADDPAGALPDLFRRCHERLTRTRGVVMSLASFDAGARALTWLGVGNVEGILLRADGEASPPTESILLLGGVVGYQLPSLRPSTTRIDPGDTLVLTTDGIRSGYRDGLRADDQAPQDVADRILRDHARGNDDALALVVRFLEDE